MPEPRRDDPLHYPDRPAYNLLDERWIPVRWRDGRDGDVGLLELFRHAGEIEGIAESSPPAFVALHRVLVATVQRAMVGAHGRFGVDERVQWFEQGLPVQPVVDYLEHWRERFWLFHPTQPFMQVAALRGPLPPKAPQRFGPVSSADQGMAPQPEPKPLARILLERVCGNNPVMFDHSIDEAPQPVAVPEALRQLLGHLQFAPGVPVKSLCKSGNDLSGPLFNSVAFVPIGRSIGPTLVLGLVPTTAIGADVPSWEHSPLSIDRILARPVLASGPCDRYTRLTRACLLLPDAHTGSVDRLLFAEGLALEEDPMASDPMNAWKAGRTAPWVCVTFNEGRALWRDLGALLPDASGAQARPAPIIESALRTLSGLDTEQPLDFVAAGIAAKPGQDKKERGRIERHRLPQRMLTSPDVAEQLRAQLRRAEQIFDELHRAAVRLLALTLPDPTSKDTIRRATDLAKSGPLAATFFSAAERSLPRLLDLVGDDDRRAHREWSAALLGAAEQAWQSLDATLGASADALRARALGEAGFHRVVRGLRDDGADATPSPNAATQEMTP